MVRFLFITCFLACSSFASAQDEIRIGAVVPLSGDSQVFGKEAQLAMNHALADAPAKRFKYSLYFEDDQLTAAKATSAARHLMDVRGVSVIFSQWSYGGHAVASAIRGREVINMAYAWDSEILNQGDNNFLTSPPPKKLAQQAIARVKAEGAKSLVLLGIEEAGTQQLFSQIETRAAEEGLTILRRVDIAPTEILGIASILTKFKTQKPDYILLCLLLPQYGEVFKQMRRQHFDVPVGTIGQSAYDKAFSGIVPKRWWSVDFQATPEQAAKIQERTGLQHLAGYPAYYDGLRAIIDTYEKAPPGSTPSFAWVKEELGKYRRKGALYGDIAMLGRRIDSDNVVFIDEAARY